MTSGRKHISQDNSCTKQCQFLQRRDMHFNPETFNVAMQILRVIIIIIISSSSSSSTGNHMISSAIWNK